MSKTEQPANPPLTRKQMREIRNTGSTPVITADTAAEAADPVDELDEATFVVEPSPGPGSAFGSPAPQPVAAPVTVVPLPRAADPVVVGPAPVADAAVDLGASPLTRRQARQQERIRTASVPVITPEVAAAHTASLTAAGSPPALTRDQPVSASSGMHDLFSLATAPAPVVPAPVERDESPVESVETPADHDEAPEADAAEPESTWEELDADVDETDAKEQDRVVNPRLGAGLLASEPEQAPLPASFDQLLSRSTGTVSMPNALILSQAPEIAPISAPMSATGEVLITGTLNLPEGLGSTGHALGTADGKEVDAALIDGELPAHSSPTPIAASAAISTVKTAGEVIRPPVPEKGSKLMLTLAITAGALALALVGVLILAFVTGAL